MENKLLSEEKQAEIDAMRTKLLKKSAKSQEMDQEVNSNIKLIDKHFYDDLFQKMASHENVSAPVQIIDDTEKNDLRQEISKK